MTPFGIRKRIKSLLGMTPKAPPPEKIRYAVNFVLPDGSSYVAEADPGDTLVLASGRGSSPIDTGCADCSCATCRVEVLGGTSGLSDEAPLEAATKRANGVPEAGWRLGCQTKVIGAGVTVKIVNVMGAMPE